MILGGSYCRDTAEIGKDMRTEASLHTPQHFYTVSQAAEVLKISRNGLYRLIRNGSIRAVQIGGLKRVLSSELDRLANSHHQ